MENSAGDQTIKMRIQFAPRILAALLQRSHQGNDDRVVAHAVSLSDKLARAIVLQLPTTE